MAAVTAVSSDLRIWSSSSLISRFETNPFVPCDMLLCIEKGVVSPEDTDPRLRELMDDRRDLCDGVAGKGFSSSLPNSLNNLSSPGCI